MPNPERGWVQQIDIFDDGDVEYVQSLGIALGNARIRLDDYRDQSLPTAFLDDLAAGFDRVRAAGLQLVIRFQYNDGDGGDASLARILEHIGQLAPVLQANADVIATVQAGFIGAWGEWHGSTNGLDDDDSARKQILAALLEAVPASRMVQVRTPHYKETLYPGGPLTPADAFGGSDRARIGHHNDCFLASDSDDGTYKRPVEDWKVYVANDGKFTPVGGETCKQNAPRSDCATAVAEARANHWSYMNRAYHPDVLADWTDQGCISDFDRDLGYRFEMIWAGWSESATAGEPAQLELAVENVGFAAMYNQRPVYAVIGRGASRIEIPLEGIDAREWAPGQRTEIKASLSLPADLAPGSYPLSLWLPGTSSRIQGRAAYAVRFSTLDMWDEAEATNLITDDFIVH